MKTTIFGVLLDVNADQDTVLRRLMREYGFMMRFAFKRLSEGVIPVGALERHCASETGLPLRYAKDAVQDAQELITSRRQAMRDGLTLWKDRVKKTVARLTALKKDHPDSRRIPGLERKLLRQQEHVAFYQQHVTDKSFPPVIFGTRQLFLERFHTLADPLAECQRQKVWKERWDEGRNGRLSARGDRTKTGNPLLRLHEGPDHWLLEMSLDERDSEKKGIHYLRLFLPLYVARKVHSQTGKINGRDYEGLLRRVLASRDPYQVEILRRHGRYQVRITVEEKPAPLQTYPVNGWVGVDTNVTFLALCHVQPDGNPQSFATFGDGRLYDARATQREAIIGAVAHQTVQWAKERGAGLVVEGLNFIHDKDLSAKFNRVTHQFTYRAFLTALTRQAAREGVEVRQTKPAYTSVIGRFKYQPQYGISVHHAAALVIGRRGGLKVRRENVPKALREWMQRRGKWNDRAYRKADWSAWNAIKKEISTVLLKQHQYLTAWLDQRHQIYQH